MRRSPGARSGPRRVGGQRLGGDPPLGAVEGDDVLGAEEGVARDQLRCPRAAAGELRRSAGGSCPISSTAARGRRPDGPALGAAAAPMPKTATTTFSANSSKLMSSCSRATWARRYPVDPVPRTSIERRSGSQPATPPRRRSTRRARRGPRSRGSRARRAASRRSSRRSAPPRGRRPGAGRRRATAEEAARAGRLDQADRAVDDRPRSTRWPCAEVEDRRLGEAADDLVGRRRRQVGAARERAPRAAGRRRGGARPRPRHGEGHAVRMGDLGELGDVGDRAEVGGGTTIAATASGLVEAHRRAAGVRQWATPSSGSSSGAANSGRGRRGRGRRSPSSGRCAGRPRACRPVGEGEGMQVVPPEAPLIRNQLRRAPQASAASSCARWNGVESGPMSTPSIPAGKVVQDGGGAQRFDQPPDPRRFPCGRECEGRPGFRVTWWPGPRRGMGLRAGSSPGESMEPLPRSEVALAQTGHRGEAIARFQGGGEGRPGGEGNRLPLVSLSPAPRLNCPAETRRFMWAGARVGVSERPARCLRLNSGYPWGPAVNACRQHLSGTTFTLALYAGA